MSEEKIEIVRKSPPKTSRPGRPRKYPFNKMIPGDSFSAKSSYINMWGCIKNYTEGNDTRGVEFKIVRSDNPGHVDVFCVRKSLSGDTPKEVEPVQIRKSKFKL